MSLLLRLVFVLSLPGSLKFDDEFEYWRMVDNFLNGRGLVVNDSWKAFRPPLYPLLLSGLVKLGVNLAGIRIFQAFISAITVVGIYFLGKEVFSRKVGWLAGILASVYPFFIFYSGFLLTETLFIFLTVWSLWQLVRMVNDFSWYTAMTAGVALGLAGLCRPTMELFVPVGLTLVLLSGQVYQKRWKQVSITAGVFILVLSPWVVRNYLLLGKFVPGTTMGGWVFWEGNNPHSEGGPCRVFPEEISKIPESQRDTFLYRQTWKVIKANPRRYAWLLQNKFRRFWNVVPNAGEFTRPFYRVVSVLSFGILLPFFLLGFLRSFVNAKARFINILIIFFTLFHMVYLASIRYRVAIEPFVLILAVYGWFYLVNKFSQLFPQAKLKKAKGKT